MDHPKLSGPVDADAPNAGESQSSRASHNHPRNDDPAQRKTHRKSDNRRAQDGRQAGAAGSSRPGNGRRKKQKAEPFVPSARALRATLNQLLQLVAARIITPAECNAMRATIMALLESESVETQGRANQGVSPSMRQAVKDNSELLSIFANLMSDEQLAELADDDEDVDRGDADDQDSDGHDGNEQGGQD